jgi:lipid-binding SYLF domain-containing protein
MIGGIRFIQTVLVLLLASATQVPAIAAPKGNLDSEARAALQSLYAKAPAAKALRDKAKGILVFPSVTKAGFVVGGQTGDGVLYEGGKRTGYYNTTAGTIGLQAGAQKYGYALFFMTDEDLKYLKSSKGWSVGTGPNIVIADEGTARDASSLTVKSGVYAFIFGQKGLMAGVGLVGQKISKTKP